MKNIKVYIKVKTGSSHCPMLCLRHVFVIVMSCQLMAMAAAASPAVFHGLKLTIIQMVHEHKMRGGELFSPCTGGPWLFLFSTA